MVCNAVRAFFIKGYLPNGVKATALALIPKHSNASSLADFRPIALCNTIYKIIAKVLALRIKNFMPLIIRCNQSGFIKARVSTDNILLAKELLSYTRNVRGIKYFCAKLDIRKAFDTVSREFLLKRMIQKGFPSRYVGWIKACINNVNFSLVINGALEGYFNTTAGLRQGCPLSPYLFCIVMDALSNLLDDGDFRGINVDGFALSHLLYADEVLVFGEATVENCIKLANILNVFADTSGLKVNLEKSSILLPRNMSNSEDICQALNIYNITHLITYLGVPLSFNRLRISDFLPLMEKATKKLSGWFANLLSFAGRLQFLKFTIVNSIAYWIRGAIIPKAVIKYFKKISSKFLFFGDLDVGKKLHMLSWEEVCKPKTYGGLGLPSVQALQFAYNCSVILRMYNSDSALSKWLVYRYNSPWKPPLSLASTFWKSVCATAVASRQKFKFKIHDKAPSPFFGITGLIMILSLIGLKVMLGIKPLI
ncbi:hypothetical protein KFK09_004512 [Dendrobium nobile]|uniref:Reverse transcriptase domain-containing protein n=1 Tax=Dendrobium nobile TaxID=94219 RepID=A0A8T3C6A7_DENNO|nr:hypothetical protein KFK09_004512 [Dendrobium nobile]